MNKHLAKIAVLVVAISATTYLALVWFTLRTNIDVSILTIVTDDSYPLIPRPLAKAYLSVTDYDPNGLTQLGMPAYSFITAGYGLEGRKNDQRILQLSQQFLDKGANINSLFEGFSPLHGAVLANQPELVRHLLENGADTKQKLDRPGRPINGMNALELAKFLKIARKKENWSKVLELLEAQHNN